MATEKGGIWRARTHRVNTEKEAEIGVQMLLEGGSGPREWVTDLTGGEMCHILTERRGDKRRWWWDSPCFSLRVA